MTARPRKYRHLVVVHYHLRPGGVRRIVELALPFLARVRPLESVTIASGEAVPADWRRQVVASLDGTRVIWRTEPAFAYVGEQNRPAVEVRDAIRSAIERLVPCPDDTLVWLQNPGVARNAFLPSEWSRWAARNGGRVLFHHHDFWFENRWQRWPELRGCGFRSLRSVARALFPIRPQIGHLTINRLDYGPLKTFAGRSARWLPNLVLRDGRASDKAVREARQWMAGQLGDRAPVWVFPTRLLRRKNLAEAVLLTRWLRPEAWFVTTAGVSSEPERDYARRLEDAARRARWKVRFRLLARATRAPSVGAIVQASEAVLLTSAQEGFGLPYLEAAAARRPLIARRLPQVASDLSAFGFDFPCLYDEVHIDTALIDLHREAARQEALWRAWRARLPAPCRALAATPWGLEPGARTLPFSRLTLHAQLEVLSLPTEVSWAACRPLNPHLAAWREMAGRLPVTVWPEEADRHIGGTAYATGFWAAADDLGHTGVTGDSVACQHAFIRQRLGRRFLYPILYGDD